MFFRPLFLLLLSMLPNPLAPAVKLPSFGAQSPIVPAILGTWQAGKVLAVDRTTHQMHIDNSPVNPDLSDNTLMPAGQRLELVSGYDKASDVAYWQISWLPPFPANACQYPFLQFHCTEVNGVNKPDQVRKSLEFTMEVNSKEINYFSPVGAPATGRIYYLRCGANNEWTPEFYVSKDRQSMWNVVALPDHKKYYGLQEYHRVAEYKRP